MRLRSMEFSDADARIYVYDIDVGAVSSDLQCVDLDARILGQVKVIGPAGLPRSPATAGLLTAYLIMS